MCLCRQYDVFLDKMKVPETHIRLRSVLSGYEGKTAEDAQEAITERFKEVAAEAEQKRARASGRPVTHIEGMERVTAHYTTATDTESITHVFEGCRSVIQQNNLRRLNMLY